MDRYMGNEDDQTDQSGVSSYSRPVSFKNVQLTQQEQIILKKKQQVEEKMLKEREKQCKQYLEIVRKNLQDPSKTDKFEDESPALSAKKTAGSGSKRLGQLKQQLASAKKQQKAVPDKQNFFSNDGNFLSRFRHIQEQKEQKKMESMIDAFGDSDDEESSTKQPSFKPPPQHDPPAAPNNPPANLPNPSQMQPLKSKEGQQFQPIPPQQPHLPQPQYQPLPRLLQPDASQRQPMAGLAPQPQGFPPPPPPNFHRFPPPPPQQPLPPPSQAPGHYQPNLPPTPHTGYISQPQRGPTVPPPSLVDHNRQSQDFRFGSPPQPPQAPIPPPPPSHQPMFQRPPSQPGQQHHHELRQQQFPLPVHQNFPPPPPPPHVPPSSMETPSVSSHQDFPSHTHTEQPPFPPKQAWGQVKPEQQAYSAPNTGSTTDRGTRQGQSEYGTRQRGFRDDSYAPRSRETGGSGTKQSDRDYRNRGSVRNRSPDDRSSRRSPGRRRSRSRSRSIPREASKHYRSSSRNSDSRTQSRDSRRGDDHLSRRRSSRRRSSSSSSDGSRGHRSRRSRSRDKRRSRRKSSSSSASSSSPSGPSISRAFVKPSANRDQSNLNTGVSAQAPISGGLGSGLGAGLGVQTPTFGVSPSAGQQQPQLSRLDLAIQNNAAAYAKRFTGGDHLTEEQQRQLKQQRELQEMFSMITQKKQAMDAAQNAVLKAQQVARKLSKAKQSKHEYDSDEEVDPEHGTWEHQARLSEMAATRAWADSLTEMNRGKHHIGDFLPPDELKRFMETYQALKDGREPDHSDYKEFKLQCDNIGFKMLQKMGWQEGQGLGQTQQGIVNPVDKGPVSQDGRGLGVDKPQQLDNEDDEYAAYRKRMMLAYRFRPNPLANE